MKLLCDKCHKEEDILLLANDQVRFECGNTRELSVSELKELFRRYGAMTWEYWNGDEWINIEKPEEKREEASEE